MAETEKGHGNETEKGHGNGVQVSFRHNLLYLLCFYPSWNRS